MAITKNIGEPGIFDQYANTARSQQMQQRYGIDPSMGANNFAGVAQQARTAGMTGQADAMRMYQQQAMGKGPSIAEQQMRMQSQRNMADSMALAARSRGGNIAGQQQQAMAGNAYAQAQTNQQAAMLRAQEQQAAMQGYAGLAGQLSQQGLGYDQLGVQASLGGAQNALGWYSADRGMDFQQQEADRAFALGLYDRGADLAKSIAGGAGGAAGAGMMSDERAKEGVRPTTLAASQAVGDITPAAFNYKPGMGPGGQRVGVMAQDLEQNPMTQSLVTEGPDGLKRVDVGGLAALATAASAEQEGRIRVLEQQSPGVTNAVPRTQMRNPAVAQYAPDEDISLGDRMATSRSRQMAQGRPDFLNRSDAGGSYYMPAQHIAALAGTDPNNMLRSYRPAQSMSTPSPFDEQRGSSGLSQLLSDRRAKTSAGSTISQQMTRNSRGGY